MCSPPLTLLRSVCLCVRRTGNYDFAVMRHAAHIAAPWKLGSGGDLSPRRVDVAGQADIVCFLFPRRPLIPLRDGAVVSYAVGFVSGLRSKRKLGTEQARTSASRLCRTHLPGCGQHTAHVDARCRSDACVSPRHLFVETRERQKGRGRQKFKSTKVSSKTTQEKCSGTEAAQGASMRVYMHYEEEDPNHTAVLTSTGPDTLLDDLLCDFLRSYVDHYGEGAADLDAALLELRSSKQKKLKRAGKVSEQVQDRDDIFVVRGTVTTVKKSRRKQIVLDLPSAQAAAIHRPSPVAAQPVAARAASGIGEEDGDYSAQVAEADRMHTMQEEMRAVALEQAQANAKPVGQFNNVTGTDRFAHHFDRKILGNAEDDQIIDASPMPTQEAIVQANCLKCRQHMFYPGQTALVSCHACKLLHMGVECPHCGTFFPAPADAGRMACPVCSGQGDLSTFEAQRRKSFISDDAISSLELAEEPQDIHLIMQYYCDKNPERQLEVDECLRKNLANPYIRHVHVLTENPMDMTPFTQGKGDKLVQYVQVGIGVCVCV